MKWDEQTVVARVERVTLRDLRLWVRQGWVRPVQGAGGPVFDELDLARIALLRDLRTDMALPADTLDLILNLIDRLHEARCELRWMAEAVQSQPDDIREAVLQAFAARRSHSE